MQNNPNCYYNYAIGKLVPEIIMEGGLPFEEHKVTTEDGYILTMHRIPNTNHPNKQKSVMFLQHGMVTNSGNFIAMLNESLAFTLAHNGYDVWMGNYRGNQYSNKHINMTVYDHKYWDYCVDEIGTKDLPAMLQYVNAVTNANGDLIFVGHSLGTTAALMFASELHNKAKSFVKLFILMAPAHLLAHMKSPLALMIPAANQIYSFVLNMDLIRIASDGEVTLPLARTLCLESPKLMELCVRSLDLVYGPTDNVQPETWPIFFDQHPTGTSLKVVKQLTSFMKRFTKFDYGLNNIYVYNQLRAPEYNLNNINVPMHIMTSEGDWLTPIRDAFNLYYVLPPQAKYGIYQMPMDNFNHISYVFGKYTKPLVNDYVLSFISQFNKKIP